MQLDQQDLTLRIAGSVTSDQTVTVTNRCGVQVGDSSVSNVDALGFSQTVTAGTTFDFDRESRLTLTIPIPASGRVECVVSAGAGSDTISITRDATFAREDLVAVVTSCVPDANTLCIFGRFRRR